MGALPIWKTLEELVKRFVDARVLVCGHDERVALLLEYGLCTVDGRIDQCDDLQARTQFAASAYMSDEESADCTRSRTVQNGMSGSKDLHPNLHSGKS